MEAIDAENADGARARRLKFSEELQKAVVEGNAPIGAPIESGFNYGPTTHPPDAPSKVRCENTGHNFAGKPVVYRDGVIVTRCRYCDDRLAIEPFAGNFTAKRLSALITDAMVQDPPGQALILLREALEQFEQEQLDGANMIELAREAIDTIAKRV